MKIFWNKLHVTLKVGLIMLIIGSTPFFVIMSLDSMELFEAGNLAMGAGPLIFLTFWPSIILIIIGVVLTLVNKRTYA